jgi:hypothetical protein
VIAALIGLALVAINITTPKRLLLMMLAWLAVMGTVRRIVPAAPHAIADPLLLIAPCLLVLLTAVAVRNGAMRRRGALANAVLAMNLISVLGAFNPAQGSLLAGLAGLLFFFIPQLGFWIGRGLCDDRTVISLAVLVAALAPLVALYGLAQTFGMFPSWDQAWVQAAVVRGYMALMVNGSVRAFATFSAASEFAIFIGLGIVFWLAFGFNGPGRILVALVLCLLGLSLVLESGRSALVITIAAVLVVTAARRRLPIWAAVPVIAGATAILPLFSSQLLPATSALPIGGLVSHQFNGLANPLGTDSTLSLHTDLVTSGLGYAFAHPLGIGIGAVSIASSATRFGPGDQSHFDLNQEGLFNTEIDPSNVSVALGLPGLGLYLVIALIGIWKAYRRASFRRDAASLIALGALIAVLLEWFNGGNYAVAFIPWLMLGWLDQPEPRPEKPT